MAKVKADPEKVADSVFPVPVPKKVEPVTSPNIEPPPAQPEAVAQAPMDRAFSAGGGESDIVHKTHQQVSEEAGKLSGMDKIKYVAGLMDTVPDNRILFGRGPATVTMEDIRAAADEWE